MDVNLLPIWFLASESAAPSGRAETMWVFAFILAVTLGLLALEKIHKTIVVLLGAILSLVLAAALWEGYPPLHDHGPPVYIPMIEWEVIGIVVGATVFVEVSARSGLFTWISIKILKASLGDPFRLLIYLSILTVIFSAFLDNITSMIIVGSLTVVACRKLELDPKPFLVTEGVMTNVGGLLTLISSIPNIIIGKAAQISYLQFLVVTLPYVVLSVAASMFLARMMFPAIRTLKDETERARSRELVEAFDEWDTVRNKRFFYTSMGGVVLVILGFAFHDQLPIFRQYGIEVVAMTAGVLMLLLHGEDVEHDLDNVEWSLVFFFIGLFTIIGVAEEAGVLLKIGELLTHITAFTGSVGLLWLTALFSSVTDNIPLAAMLAKIYGEAEPHYTYWWAIVFGANLGGNITPIGSASTVVAVTIMKKNDLKISFLEFVKIGGTFALLQLLLAGAYVLALSAVPGLAEPGAL